MVVSAPAGTGKTSLVTCAKSHCSLLRQTVSCTSRKARGDEQEGIDYFFISKEKFKTHIANHDFIEWVELFGEFYGTLRSQVEQLQRQGNCAILVIDVQGALNIKRQFSCVTIFISPPSLAELKKRLIKRGTESQEKIEQRLSRAQSEIMLSDRFDHHLINDDFQTTLADFERIIGFEMIHNDFHAFHSEK